MAYERCLISLSRGAPTRRQREFDCDPIVLRTLDLPEAKVAGLIDREKSTCDRFRAGSMTSRLRAW